MTPTPITAGFPRSAATDAQPAPLSLWVRFGWGVGSLGSTTVIYAQAFFLLFFFTTVLGLRPEVAGTILLVAKLSDIAAGLIVGRLSDGAHTRWGRRKPFLLAGALVGAIGSYLVFNPPFVSPLAQVLTLCVMGLGYCLFTVPYLAMPSEMTTCPAERTLLMSWRVVFVSVGELVAKSLFPLILTVAHPGRPAYAALGLACAAVVGAPMLLCLVLSPTTPSTPVAQRRHGSFLADVAAVARNHGFVVVMLTKIPQSIALTAGYAAMLFFFTTVLGHTPAALAVWGVISNLCGIAALAFWIKAALKLGKKAVFFIGVIGYAGVTLTWMFAGRGEPLVLIALRAAMIGPFASAPVLMGQAMLPDVIEDDRKRHGHAREAAYTSVYSLVEKSCSAIGPFIAGWIFHFLHFDPRAGGVVTPDARHAVYICVVAIPVVSYLAGLIPLSFYKLDKIVRRPPEALRVDMVSSV